MNGYIKVWRKIEQTSIFTSSEAVHVFLFLLVRANRKKRTVVIGNQVVELKPGQLATGRKAIADATGINESKVYRVLELLKNEQLIEQQARNKFSIITVRNWSQYQESEQQNEQQVNSKRTATEHRQEDKEKTKSISHPEADDKYSDEFEAFWSKYPKRVKKLAAFKAFQKKRLGNGRFASVMDGLERWLKSRQWAEGYVHDPTTWINAGCYDDDPEQKPFRQGTLVL